MSSPVDSLWWAARLLAISIGVTGVAVGVGILLFFFIRNRFFPDWWLKGISAPVAGALRKYGPRPFFRLADTFGRDNAPDAISRGFGPVTSLLAAFGPLSFLPIAHRAGRDFVDVCTYGLAPFADRLTTVAELESHALRCIEIYRSRNRAFLPLLPVIAANIQNDGDFAQYLNTFESTGAQEIGCDDFSWAAGRITSVAEFRSLLTGCLRLGELSQRRYQRLTVHLTPNAEVVRRYGLEPVIEIARAAGSDADTVLAKGLPAIEPLVVRYGIAPFVEIARCVGPSTGLLFTETLPAVQQLIERFGIESFAACAHEAGPHLPTLCYCIAQRPGSVSAGPELRELSLWRKVLYEARLGLKRPIVEEYPNTDPYSSDSVSLRLQDPEQKWRNEIDEALIEVRRRVAQTLEPGLLPSLVVHAELPPAIAAFLDRLSDVGLDDVVLLGGAPRDILLGRFPQDLDVTFALDLLPEDIALAGDSYLWNSVLAGALRHRQLELDAAIGRSGSRRGEETVLPRTVSMRVDYVGPYEVTIQDHYRRARFSAVFSKRDGRLFTLDAGIGINSIGVTTDRRWIGDPEAFDDFARREIRTRQPPGKLPPDVALRYLILKHETNFSLAADLEPAFRRLAERARTNGKDFVAEVQRSHATAGVLRRILDFPGDSVIDDMRRLGVLDAYANLPIHEAERLKTRMAAEGSSKHRRPATQRT